MTIFRGHVHLHWAFVTFSDNFPGDIFTSIEHSSIFVTDFVTGCVHFYWTFVTLIMTVFRGYVHLHWAFVTFSDSFQGIIIFTSIEHSSLSVTVVFTGCVLFFLFSFFSFFLNVCPLCSSFFLMRSHTLNTVFPFAMRSFTFETLFQLCCTFHFSHSEQWIHVDLSDNSSYSDQLASPVAVNVCIF